MDEWFSGKAPKVDWSKVSSRQWAALHLQRGVEYVTEKSKLKMKRYRTLQKYIFDMRQKTMFPAFLSVYLKALSYSLLVSLLNKA